MTKKHTELCHEQPKPASEGLPCELCIKLEAYTLRATELEHQLEHQVELVLAPAKAILRQIKDERAKLLHSHPKCVDCGILFGGLHLERIPTDDGLCGSCLRARKEHHET